MRPIRFSVNASARGVLRVSALRCRPARLSYDLPGQLARRPNLRKSLPLLSLVPGLAAAQASLQPFLRSLEKVSVLPGTPLPLSHLPRLRCKLLSRPGLALHKRALIDEISADRALRTAKYAVASSPAVVPARADAPDRSSRIESACACRLPIPGRSRFRRCIRPWHEPTIADVPPPPPATALKSNSQHASITSNPLFIRVAESIVIRLPIFQVG